VMFKGKRQFWPVKNAEQISPGVWAVKCEFWDIMNDQDRFKKTIMTKAILRSARRRRN
jgi:hypothetical protein